MRFLVIRKFDELSRVLLVNGYQVINCPTIKTAAESDLSAFDARLDEISRFDGVFLTSRIAAEIFRKRLYVKGITFGGKVYVFGRRGFETLRHDGLDLYFDDSAATVEEMLAKIDPEILKGKRFLIVCGDRSLGTVSDYLSRFSEVECAVVYRTVDLAVDPELRAKIQIRAMFRDIGFICFFSPSGAESFIRQFGTELLMNTNIAVIGKTTAEYFERRGLKVEFISPKPTAVDLAHGLIEYLRQAERSKAKHSTI